MFPRWCITKCSPCLGHLDLVCQEFSLCSQSLHSFLFQSSSVYCELWYLFTMLANLSSFTGSLFEWALLWLFVLGYCIFNLLHCFSLYISQTFVPLLLLLLLCDIAVGWFTALLLSWFCPYLNLQFIVDQGFCLFLYETFLSFCQRLPWYPLYNQMYIHYLIKYRCNNAT